MLKTDKSGVFKNTQIMNEKIVEDDVKFIKKEQLVQYIQFLINKYTVSIFSDYGDTKEMIVKKIKRKTKRNIIDIINYNLFSKDIKQNIKLAIKGIDENSKDLIKVKVTKTVNKII